MIIDMDYLLLAEGYQEDAFCKKLWDLRGKLECLQEKDGLLFVGERLVVPRVGSLRESLSRLAQDLLGHSGFEKCFTMLRTGYYWPRMKRELEQFHTPSCAECSRNRDAKSNFAGLSSLPVPFKRGDSVAISFIGPLPEDGDHDAIVVITDRSGADMRIVPCRMHWSAEEFAGLFFDVWYCENGLPLEIVSDRHEVFMTILWRTLRKLTGIKLKSSSSHYPGRGGSKEYTDDAVTQYIRAHVGRNEAGWVKTLPRLRFQIMDLAHKFTGLSRFQLHMGRAPRRIPVVTAESQQAALDAVANSDISHAQAAIHLIQRLQTPACETLKSLAIAAASHRVYHHISDQCESNLFRERHCESRQRLDGRVSETMSCYDVPPCDGPRTDSPELTSGSHSISAVDSLFSIPPSPLTLATPNGSDGRRCELRRPDTWTSPKAAEEWIIDHIVDERRQGPGVQYLVRWVGYSAENDLWLPRPLLKDTEALDRWMLTKLSAVNGP